MREAHGDGVIHGDLIPRNLMLTRDGHVKTMDFGLAKLLPSKLTDPDATHTTSITATGAAVGTLAYMSPEQLHQEAVDARSDIFAFGVLFHEMLAGTHPFRKALGLATANAIVNSAPRPSTDS